MKRLAAVAAVLAATLILPTIAGARIAFTKEFTGTNPTIWVANDDGTGQRALKVRGVQPVVSPSGEWIAYQYITDVRTYSTELRFVFAPENIVFRAKIPCGTPVWDPTSWFVLCSTTSEDFKGDVRGIGLALVTRAGDVTQLVKPRGKSVSGYTWSPLGKKIAYSMQSYPGTIAGPRLYTANPDGTGVRNLGPGYGPVWGPTHIAYAQARVVHNLGQKLVRSEIWTMNPDDPTTGGQLTAFRGKGLITGPEPVAWTPDGSSVVARVIGEDYLRAAVVPVGTGVVRLFGPANTVPVAVSADGAQALLNTNVLGGGAAKAYAAPIAGGAARLLLGTADTLSASANWQP